MKQILVMIAILVMVSLGIMTGYRNGYEIASAKFKANAEQLQGKQERLLEKMEMLKGQIAMTETYQAREFEFTAYAYNSGHTASGTIPEEGRTIAVDPAVIPLGSVVYVEGYGVRVAEDTGAYIKGNRMDLFIEDWNEAKEFGRKKLQVVILEREQANIHRVTIQRVERRGTRDIGTIEKIAKALGVTMEDLRGD